MIQKTVNDGKTWVSQESGTTLNLTSVCFRNDSMGYITGEFMTQCSGDDCNKSSVLLNTKNGGLSWKEREIPEIIGGITSFPSDKTGYCFGQDKMYILKKIIEIYAD